MKLNEKLIVMLIWLRNALSLSGFLWHYPSRF